MILRVIIKSFTIYLQDYYIYIYIYIMVFGLLGLFGGSKAKSTTSTKISNLLSTEIENNFQTKFETNIQTNIDNFCEGVIAQSFSMGDIIVSGNNAKVNLSVEAINKINCQITNSTVNTVQRSMSQSLMQSLEENLTSSAMNKLDQAAKGGFFKTSTSSATNTEINNSSYTSLRTLITVTVEENITTDVHNTAKQTMVQKVTMGDLVISGNNVIFNNTTKAGLYLDAVFKNNLLNNIVNTVLNTVQVDKNLTADSLTNNDLKQKAKGGGLLDGVLGLDFDFGLGSSGSGSISCVICIICIILSIVAAMKMNSD